MSDADAKLQRLIQSRRPIPAAERTEPAGPDELSRVWWHCVQIILADAEARGALPPEQAA